MVVGVETALRSAAANRRGNGTGGVLEEVERVTVKWDDDEAKVVRQSIRIAVGAQRNEKRGFYRSSSGKEPNQGNCIPNEGTT